MTTVAQRQSMPNTGNITKQQALSITVQQLQLTSNEQSFYETIFNSVNKTQNNIITGPIVRDLFVHTNLSKAVLAEIWSLSDRQKRKYLDYTDFMIALRFVVLAQNDIQLTYNNLVQSHTDLPLPKFNIQFDTARSNNSSDGMNLSRQSSTQNNASFDAKFSPTEATNSATDWSMSDTERTQYITLFQQADSDNDGYIGGNDAVQFFNTSGLNKQELRKIWLLSDIDRDNRLNRDEFCIAMHLVLRVRKKAPIPSHLPAELDFRRNNLISPSVSPIVQPPSSKHSRRNSQSEDNIFNYSTADNSIVITPYNVQQSSKQINSSKSDTELSREVSSAKSEPTNNLQATDLFSDILPRDDNVLNKSTLQPAPLFIPGGATISTNTSITSPLHSPAVSLPLTQSFEPRTVSQQSSVYSTDQYRAELSTVAAQNSELSKNLITSVSELDNNNTELYILKSKLEHSKQQNIELTNKYNTTQQQLQQSTTQLQTLQQQYDTQVSNNKQMNEQIQQAIQQTNDKQEQYDTLQTQLNSAKQEYQQLKYSQDEQLNSITLLDNNVAQLQQQLQQCQQSIVNEQSFVQQYETQLQTLNNEYSVLQQQYRTTQQKLDNVKNEVQTLQNNVEQQTQQNSVLSKQCADVRQQYATAQVTLSQLQSQYEELTNNANALKQQCDKDNNKYKSVVTQCDTVTNNITQTKQLIERYTAELQRIQQLNATTQQQLQQQQQQYDTALAEQQRIQSELQQQRNKQATLRTQSISIVSPLSANAAQSPSHPSITSAVTSPNTSILSNTVTNQVPQHNKQLSSITHSQSLHDALHTQLPTSPTPTTHELVVPTIHYDDSVSQLTIHDSNNNSNTSTNILTNNSIHNDIHSTTHDIVAEQVIDADADVYNLDDIDMPNITNHHTLSTDNHAHNPFAGDDSTDFNNVHVNDPFSTNTTHTNNLHVNGHSNTVHNTEEDINDPFADTTTPTHSSKPVTDCIESENPFDTPNDPFATPAVTHTASTQQKSPEPTDWANFS